MIIVLEGMNGVGKSTVAHYLINWLEQRGARAAYYRSPGGTVIGEYIRSIVKDPTTDACPETNLLLFSAAKTQLLHEINDKITDGYWIVLDRWWQSSYAYQGAAGIPTASIKYICADMGLLLEDYDHVDILLKAPSDKRVDAAAKAAADNGEPQDAFEMSDGGYLATVNNLYNELTYSAIVNTVDPITGEFRLLSGIAKDIMMAVVANCHNNAEVQELFTR